MSIAQGTSARSNIAACGKWFSLLIFVATVVVYIESIRSYRLHFWGTSIVYQCEFGNGSCSFMRETRRPFGFYLHIPFDEPPRPLRWNFEYERAGADWYVNIPIWPLVLASAAISGMLWYRDRASVSRRRAGACVRCGYDLRGLTANARCPECGYQET